MKILPKLCSIYNTDDLPIQVSFSANFIPEEYLVDVRVNSIDLGMEELIFQLGITYLAINHQDLFKSTLKLPLNSIHRHQKGLIFLTGQVCLTRLFLTQTITSRKQLRIFITHLPAMVI